MDKVSLLLQEISAFPELRMLDRRSSSFLNDVAEIYERHGGGATCAYLLNQSERRNRTEANVLLSVIERLEASPEVQTNRAIGRQIIKCLHQLKGRSKR